jgi:hypothetical protein
LLSVHFRSYWGGNRQWGTGNIVSIGKSAQPDFLLDRGQTLLVIVLLVLDETNVVTIGSGHIVVNVLGHHVEVAAGFFRLLFNKSTKIVKPSLSGPGEFIHGATDVALRRWPAVVVRGVVAFLVGHINQAATIAWKKQYDD